MADNEESRPQRETAINTNGCDKGSINSVNVEKFRINADSLSKFIIVPIKALRSNNVMEAVKICYLGKLVEDLMINRDDVCIGSSGDNTAAVILSHYHPYTDDEIWEAHNDYRTLTDADKKLYGTIPVALFERYKNEQGFCLPVRLYIALKSIIGTKPFWKTTHRFLAARMYGYSKPSEGEGLTDKDWKDKTGRFISDHRIRTGIRILEDWGLVSYYVRSLKGGTYYSFTLSQKELIKKAISIRTDAKKEERKAKRKAAEDEAYLEIFGMTKAECQAKLKAKREAAKPAKPKAEPKEEPKAEPTIPNEQSFGDAWLSVAEEQTDQRLKEWMISYQPNIEGRKVFIYTDSKNRKGYFEGEYFTKVFSNIKYRAKMPDLMLVVVLTEINDLPYH